MIGVSMTGNMLCVRWILLVVWLRRRDSRCSLATLARLLRIFVRVFRLG